MLILEIEPKTWHYLLRFNLVVTMPQKRAPGTPHHQKYPVAKEYDVPLDLAKLQPILTPGYYFQVDLHGRSSHELPKLVLNVISDALRDDKDIVLFIHGYNKGNALRNALHQVLALLQKEELLTKFAVDRKSPGQTIVEL